MSASMQHTPVQPTYESIPQEVREYLEEIIAQAQIPVFDDETKKQVVTDLFGRLDKYLALKIAENLSEDNVNIFVQMNQDKKPQEEIDAFIQQHIPNAQDMFEQAFVDFRDFYLTAQSNFAEAGKAGNPR
jgi:hypothetical protein